jgi:hypothetical protein
MLVKDGKISHITKKELAEILSAEAKFNTYIKEHSPKRRRPHWNWPIYENNMVNAVAWNMNNQYRINKFGLTKNNIHYSG